MRAEDASYKLEQLIKNREIKKLSLKTIKHGYSINVNDKLVFSILHGDAGTAVGKDKDKLKEYAKNALKNISIIIAQEKKKQDLEDFKHSIVTIFFALILSSIPLCS